MKMIAGDFHSLHMLMRECNRIATEHGWNETERNFGEVIALMHSELSEALEEWRNGCEFETIYEGEGGKPEGIAVELADTIIRILDTCQQLNIPLVKALQLKIGYNESRPYRHGGKRA